MRRISSLVCILLLLLSLLSGMAFAVDGEADNTDTSDDVEVTLPFVLEAPKYAFLDRLSDDVTEQAVNAAFTKNNSMQKFLSLSAEQKNQMLAVNGLESLKVVAQIDWSLDNQNGWHYDEYWNTEGEDPDGHLLAGDWAYIDIDPGMKKVQSVKIFEDFGDPEDKDNKSWKGFGYAKGWKDMFSEEQLKKNEENGHYYVDWTEHTLYIRVRYAVVTEDNDEEHMRNCYFSGWSPVASFGKGVEEYYPYMDNTSLPIPVLSDLSVATGNEESGAVISFDVSIPKEFEENAARTEVYGGVAHLVYCLRFNQEGEWRMIYRDAVSGRVDVPVKELLEENEEFDENTKIEVYAISWIDQYLKVGGEEWCGTLSSDYSETITLGIEKVEPTPVPTGEVTPTPEQPTVTPTPTPANQPTIEAEHIGEAAKEKKVCPVCGLEIDPQPLGFCMFFWIGGVIVLIIIISIIARIIRRKQDEKTDILFR